MKIAKMSQKILFLDNILLYISNQKSDKGGNLWNSLLIG
jgi:hypothetical protein